MPIRLVVCYAQAGFTGDGREPMTRTLLSAVALALYAGPSFAALPFTCQVGGDTWRITGGSARKATCSLVCILADGSGNQDKAACSFTTPPQESASSTVCEGFLTGRHWTSATLVSGQCSYEP